MDKTWIRRLAGIGAQAPSADNSQPWTLEWDGRELTISFAERHKDHNVFKPDSHATLLAVGAVAEHLESALSENGLPATWRWPAGFATGKPYAALSLADARGDFASAKRASGRHTNRLPYLRTPVPDPVVRQIEQSGEGANRAVAVTAQGQKASLVRLVRRSSEARFCNQRLHEWLIGSLRFTSEQAARGDGLDVRTLGLPPGGQSFLRWISDWRRLDALNRFGAYKLLALSEVGLLAAAPALVCIVGPSDARSTLDSGRLLTRLWMDLNLQGIAVHPYYVVSDQIQRLRQGTVAAGFESSIGEVEALLHRLLDLRPAETLHMIFRIGYPKATPLRSGRLPLDAVFRDTSEAGRAAAAAT